MAEGHTPTDSMASNARRGLALRKEYGRGGTAVGVARARDIANKASLSNSTVMRDAFILLPPSGRQEG